MNREAQIEKIEKTFEDAKIEIKEHHTKKNVYPEYVMPIKPDDQMWKFPCAQVIFDSDPAPFGFDPKVAFVSHSTFGQPLTSRTKHIKNAVDILKEKNVDFKFDGDMQPDVALNEQYKELYPFSSIVGNANILIMPGQHSAAISYKMMRELGGAKVIGPLLIGLAQPIEIAPLRSSTSDILNLASVAAYSAGVIDYNKK